MTTADEQRTSPIGALYPYLQHRSPACTEGCVCGVRSAVLGVEEEFRRVGISRPTRGAAHAAVPALRQPWPRVAVRTLRLLLRRLPARIRGRLARRAEAGHGSAHT
jgi:hypothetical protein